MRRFCNLIVLLASAALAFIPITSTAQSGTDFANAPPQNNWANWRGPNYDGTLGDAQPPLRWSDRQNIKWKTDVPGKGSGSPVVWEDQIILLTAIDSSMGGAANPPPNPPPAEAQPKGEEKEGGLGGRGGGGRAAPTTEQEFVVLSYNLADGVERWRTTVNKAVPHERGHQTNTFASSSAVTDGRRIFASFGSHGIYCLDMRGKILWEKQLGKQVTRNQFGEGSSPSLVKETLIVPWDHEGQSILYALDAASGEIRWQTERQEKTTWATPLAVEYDGKTQIITNGTTVRSYDLADGKLLWSCGGQASNPIPTPVRMENFVVAMTGYRGNAIYAIPLDGSGEISESEKVLWHNHDAAPYVASPTLYKGQLYFTKERTGVMSSLDAKTGKVLIGPSRLTEIRDVYASPVAAGDRIYFTGRDGTTVVVKHGDKLEELAVNKLGESVDASPAIIGNSLLIRGSDKLYRIQEAGP